MPRIAPSAEPTLEKRSARRPRSLARNSLARRAHSIARRYMHLFFKIAPQIHIFNAVSMMFPNVFRKM